MLLYFLIYYGLALVAYCVAHLISNKKWLTAYTFFLITIFVLRIHDSYRDHQMVGELGYLLWTIVIIFSCATGIVGVIGKAVVLASNYQGNEINVEVLHTVSFLGIILLGLLLLRN